VKITYIGANTGIPVLDNKRASVPTRKLTDTLIERQAVAQHVIARTLSMEPNAQKNHLLQVVRL
jgi:hypothetical protein